MLVATSIANGQAFLSGPRIAAYPLDGLPRPDICFGTSRLLSSYTANAALDLTFGASTQTVGFVGGVFDSATAATFCSGASNACYVTKWYDQCGAGLNATSAGNVNSPIWNSANSVAGASPVIFPFDNVADKTNMSISTSFHWRPGNPTTVVVVGQFLNSLNNSWFWQGSQFNGQFANAGPTTGPPGLSVRAVATNTNPILAATPADNEPAIIAMEWRDGSLIAHSNDQSSSVTAAASGSSETGAYLGASGGTAGSGTMNDDAFDATVFLVYSSYVNGTQEAAIQTKLASAFNIQQSFANVIVEDGDSFVSGKGSSFDNSIFRFSLTELKYPVRAFNNAVPGKTMAQLDSTFSTSVPTYYQSGYTVFVVHFSGGANDIRFAVPVSTIYSEYQSYINKVHALGSNAKVVIATNPLQCDIFQNPTELAALQSLNGMIIANWNVAQGSGGLGADGLDNLWATPTVGPGNYSGSVFCGFPNQYSPDGQHPTDLSMSLYGPVQAAALNAVLP